ncbi:MAG: phospholipase C, phosphocholine-specific [Bacteroidota bacterium]|nr:phospholipase C, phosphocholine-specific [Bacteroidota bacterium]
MDTRREFLKKAMLLSGAAGMATLPPSILKALAIDPDAGSTFLDAEHIVFLMQENRSFDHAFGTLRGVRGYNDPRAITLPDYNKVWLQKNAKGETFAPFRLDIKDTKITWMGSLPHSRESQAGARNNGRYDNWIEAKKSGDDEYKDMPLTMGYYTRDDIPFHYAMADAFTVCDMNFCSSLTPTDPNRVHFWSGTVRADKNADLKAFIDNGAIEQGIEWRTFPELLEQNNISWKIYQNELSVEGGFTGEEEAWLANFGDNTLEFFNQYHVKLSKRYIDYLPIKIKKLQDDINGLKEKMSTLVAGSEDRNAAEMKLTNAKKELVFAETEKEKWTREKFDNLSLLQKNIHEKAFEVNSGDPHQHELTPLNYSDDGVAREINIPKGDILDQFRKDVEKGKLPTVSWLVPPETFSDHPSAPWFGSWYLSEVMDILTKNPEVWKKTIFVLTYDENDGYFDHVPPFTAPDSRDATTGKVSKGIDTSVDWVNLEEDVPGSIGLGFRVPMVIASPWSRGGWVNSQVFDHTSSIQFLETFLNEKFKKNIKETNITDWRRTVTGDLTSVFRRYNGEKITGLPFIKKDPFIETIHKAKFKNVPSNYKALTRDEIATFNSAPGKSPYMPQQEKGVRDACAIPYELYADGNFNAAKNSLEIILGADNKIFKDKSVGSPFIVYARNFERYDFKERNYAVVAGDSLQDEWPVGDFEKNKYHLEVHGPNGFSRWFKGSEDDPQLQITVRHLPDGKVQIKFVNTGTQEHVATIADNAYGNSSVSKNIGSKASEVVTPDLSKSFGWYDFTIKVQGTGNFEKRYTGRVETGKPTKSDPVMG